MDVQNITETPSELQETTDKRILFEFIVFGIGITLVGFLGIIGNILSTFVLIQPQMKSSITYLLVGLTICDTLFISMNIICYSLKAIFVYFDVAEKLQAVFDPVENIWLTIVDDIAQTGSIYFTIAITMERYVVICWPFKSRFFCTYTRARCYTSAVVTFSLVYQFLRFYFYEHHNVDINHTEIRDNCPNFVAVGQNISAADADLEYERYFLRWPYLIFMALFPSTILVVFNLAIYRTVRSADKERLNMTSRQTRELSVTIMLLVVVLAFLLCQLVYFFMVIVERYWKCVWYKWKFYLICLDLFFVNLNSATNFAIYCAFGTKFRLNFVNIAKASSLRLQRLSEEPIAYITGVTRSSKCNKVMTASTSAVDTIITAL